MNKLKSKLLSDKDIKRALNGKTKIVKYSELVNANHIDELIKPYGNFVLIYEAKTNMGHWCCCILYKNVLTFFDSYGEYPDNQLKYTPDVFRMNNNMILPHLSYLLYNSPYQLRYNEFKLQKMEEGINTCGRWVIMRILKRNETDEEFAEFYLKKKMSSDDIVTEETYELFGI